MWRIAQCANPYICTLCDVTQAGNHGGTGITTDPAFLSHPGREGLHSNPASAVEAAGAVTGKAREEVAGEDTAAAALAARGAQEAEEVE
eukprot:scaffold73827_cov28-Tisochrysis_lutea.AAC.1